MEPEKHYLKLVREKKIQPDNAQAEAVKRLQQLHRQLIEQDKKAGQFLPRIKNFLKDRQHTPVKGVYIWGGVGRGKTWLMNLFYDALPIKKKTRLHFHHFMLDIHARLSSYSNRKNPLNNIARQLATQYQLICLDEFIVTNITDAMLLHGLLDALFSQGVTLVATSNRTPDDLYLNGLQRERFLPAIELLKTHTQVFHLKSTTDHRLSLLEQSDVYYQPVTEETENAMKKRFEAMAIEGVEYGVTLDVLDRPIPTIACADELVWFDFNILCDAPRAAQDYIELAECYHTIFLSRVPVMDEHLDDKARRFIYLIDELYDRRVKLVISAEDEPDALYTGDMLSFAYQRTSSRLIEMRSNEYLEQPHRSRHE